MNLDKKIANAVGGKTARACDCCLTKRARWYCSADDAFLCQACDASVHSANALARRHDRVQLKTASSKPPLHSRSQVNLPTWQRGPIKKTRTPRHGKNTVDPNLNLNPILTVPELGLDETNLLLSHEDEAADSLMYRVPVVSSEEKYEPLDIDLEEFAVDVESLLGKELDEECYGMEKLGFFVDGGGKDDITPIDFFKDDEDEILVNGENDDLTIRESFDFCFDYGDDGGGGGRGFLTTCEDRNKIEILEDDDSGQSFPASCEGQNTLEGRKIGDNNDEECDERVNKSSELMMMKLRLDYEAISEAWGSQGSPWMNGQRPQINHDDYWSHCMRGTSGAEMCVASIYAKQHQTGVMGGNSVGMVSDGGREARVSRYREKRRTRLFAKKIRYEVRKLNAEKRPRMKGRFVKRSSFASTTTTFSLLGSK